MHCKDAPRYVSRKIHKSLAKQFLEVAYTFSTHEAKSLPFALRPLSLVLAKQNPAVYDPKL